MADKILHTMIIILVPTLFALGVVSSTKAQQPDLQQLQDAIALLQRESAQNVDRARIAEMALAKAQRELTEAKKKAEVCRQEGGEK